MNSHSSYSNDGKPEYVPQATGHPPFGWNTDTFYTQPSGQPSTNQPYYAQHGPMVMEPAHPMLGYHSSSAQMGAISPHHGMLPRGDVHSQQRFDQAYQYHPPAVGVPHTPMFSTPPTPSLHFSAASGRLSPSSPSSMPLFDQNLPAQVRDALRAARDSPEFGRGENVPPSILMPTVQKVDKDLWACRVCGKEHKRRDHTLTHVRTAHLDNKGFRCHYMDCDSAFGRKGDLERHIATTHQNSDASESVCPRCHAQLHRKDNLMRHMRSCGTSSSSSSHPHEGSVRSNGGGTSRSSRRSDPPASAPYPTPSSRPRRHNPSITIQPQPSQLQLSMTPFYSPSDAFYDHTGLGHIDAASLCMTQPWPAVIAPYDYSSYDLGSSNMISSSWI